MDDYKYWAFISYSHSDETWGKWLHRALETYRVPRRLVGRAGRHGPLPRRVIPVFRDRDELPTASSLSDKIEKALGDSRFLIVICSPKAAVSKWVNEEIATYKKLASEDRVLCLVVDGEPNASDKPDSGLLEAFPPAVRFRVDAAGHVTEERTEPIAADVRQGKDGAANARLKLLAGMLDVNFDELKQRERRRRFWLRVRLAAGALVVAATIAGVWYHQRAQTLESERARHLRVAQLLLTKSREAAERDDEKTASFYGAESIRSSLLAGTAPLDAEFLASLALAARPDFTLPPSTDRAGPLALSPDGSLLLTGSGQDAGKLWDVRAQKLRATLSRARVGMAAFDGGNRYLATATPAGAVEVWNTATGAIVATVQSQGARVSSLALSPDGRLLAWAGDDHVISVRRLDHQAPVTTFKANEHVLCLAFSPDGSLLASGSQERHLRLWDVQRPELSRLLVHYADPVRSIAFSRDGALLAVGTWDSKVKLWDVSGRTEIAVLEGPAGHKQTVDSVAFSDDGTLLASGSLDGTVKLWEVSSHVLVATLTGHPKGIADVAFGGRADALTSVSADGTVMGWHVVPRKYVAAFTGHTKFVRAVAFSPDGRMLASAGDDTTIRLWDPATRRLLHPLEGHTDSVRALAFTPDGRWLASTGRDSRIMLWPATGATVKSVRAHDTWIFALAMTPDGRAVATAGWDRDPTVKLWAVPGLTPIKTLEGHAKGIGGLAASPDGRFLASAGNDGAVNLWNLKSYERIPLRSAQAPVMRSVAFSPDSRVLAVGDGAGWVHLWDVATRQPAGPAFSAHHLRGHDTLMIWALAFSPDGRLLASGANSKDRQTIRLWNAAERRTIAWLTGHREFALAVAFSPDGRLLASGGSDTTVRLWNTADFWPPRADSAATSGALLRTFLAAKTRTSGDAERLVHEVGCVTRLAMLGTDAVPMPAAEERRCR